MTNINTVLIDGQNVSMAALRDWLSLGSLSLAEIIPLSNTTSDNLIIGSTGSGANLTNSASGAHDGDSCVGLGFGVLLAATTAYAVTAVGSNAGGSLTTGHSNTLIAYQAGNALTIGIMNTLVGVDAGLLATSMNYCTVVGHHCLNGAIFAGEGAVVIGQQTGRTLTAGVNLIIIGRNAMANCPATGSSLSEVIGGGAGNRTAVLRSQLIGGEILANTGANTAATDSFVAGYRACFGMASVNGVTAVGNLALFQAADDTTASAGNSAIGDSAAYLVSGNNNTVFGALALRRASKQGIDHTVMIGYRVGDETGSDWSPVDHDFAIGYGPTAAERILWGNMSTGALNTKGALNIGGAITYGGVTLANAVTGTGNMVLSVAPSFTGLATLVNANVTGTLFLGGVHFAAKATNHNVIRDPTGADCILLGDATDASIQYRQTSHVFKSAGGGSTFLTVNSTGIDVVGLSRCDSLRIDQAPTAETPSATHTVPVNLNGTNYKVLCLAA